MEDSFILGAAVPDEASETMVELRLWPSIVLLHKLAMYCECIWYILRTSDFYALGLSMKEGKNVTPIVIPSKSHNVAVFICHCGVPGLCRRAVGHLCLGQCQKHGALHLYQPTTDPT
jgi:hypothetical protein